MSQIMASLYPHNDLKRNLNSFKVLFTQKYFNNLFIFCSLNVGYNFPLLPVKLNIIKQQTSYTNFTGRQAVERVKK